MAIRCCFSGIAVDIVMTRIAKRALCLGFLRTDMDTFAKESFTIIDESTSVPSSRNDRLYDL